MSIATAVILGMGVQTILVTKIIPSNLLTSYTEFIFSFSLLNDNNDKLIITMHLG